MWTDGWTEVQMDEQIDEGESGWIDGWRGKQMKDELDG